MKSKKLNILVASFVMLVAVAFILTACGKNKELTVSITNKTDLTAEWIEGEADRELKVEFKLGNEVQTDVEYLVSSNDSGVVEVGDDKKTLSAVGGGKATITVKSGEISDSVELTVIPALKGVSIKNKTELQNPWVIGEANRTLQIGFNPDHYDTEKPEYTVVSSDSSVIEVKSDKVTLEAKKMGKATITVSSGEFKDSVEISVRPALESITITNKTDLEADWEDWKTNRTIQVEFNPNNYYDMNNTNVTVVCSDANAVTIDGRTLSVKNPVENATVTVSVGNISDTFTLNIVRTAPNLVFANPGNSVFEPTPTGGVMKGIENERFIMPGFTATASDGTDLTPNVEITVLGDTEAVFEKSTGEFIAPRGTYNVEYEISDPNDTTKVTKKIVVVHTYRDIFSWDDNTWVVEKALVDDEEQVVSNTTGGYQIATFNMEATGYYYAEVEYDVKEGFPVIGLAHFKESDRDADGKYLRWLTSNVTGSNYDFKTVDFDTVLLGEKNNGHWEMNEWNNYGMLVIWSYQLVNQRGLIASSNAGIQKFAIARVGKDFYTFWNDQYVNKVSLDRYGSENTIPGLFGGIKDNQTISKINYFANQTEVEEKVRALTANGKNMINQYVPFDWANGSINTDNKNFTVGETTPEKGINYNFTKADANFNDSMVSPYIYFDGDFQFSWTYKNNSFTEGVQWNDPRMILDVRDFRYGSEIVQFGGYYSADNDTRRMLLNAPQLEDPNKWYEGQNGFDDSEGVVFTITRELTADKALYHMLAYSVASPTQRMERTIEWTGSNWDKPVILLWHNTCVAGEYTNITWGNKTETPSL